MNRFWIITMQNRETGELETDEVHEHPYRAFVTRIGRRRALVFPWHQTMLSEVDERGRVVRRTPHWTIDGTAWILKRSGLYRLNRIEMPPPELPRRRRTVFDNQPGGGVCRCLNDDSPIVCDDCPNKEVANAG